MTFSDPRPNQPRQAARGHQHDDEARMKAHAGLIARLGSLARSGAVVPCLAHRTIFRASDTASQHAAPRACLTCPAFAPCAAYITAHPEPAGTWAATTEKQRTTPEQENQPWQPTPNRPPTLRPWR